MADKYLTSPLLSDRMPGGIPYIIGNEMAERFSFYGMKAILFVFMTEHLRSLGGDLAVLSDADATVYVHRFVFATYFFPVIGAMISDALFGKYRTILALSIVYCVGHLALALNETSLGVALGIAPVEPRIGLIIGLGLIAVGAGGIKPCVSAHVGDQFGVKNQHMLGKVFFWFYFSINIGAALSTLITPFLLHRCGPSVAFGVPGVLMFLATIMFWLGRNKFIHVPAGGFDTVKETFSRDGRRAILNLIPIYFFIAIFWSLFDQTASTWVAQAKNMDRNLFGHELLPSQIQAVNPFLILILIPIFSYVIYPGINRFFTLTPLRKISIGLFVTAFAFAISGWIETRIVAGERPHILWQMLAYIVLTCAEVMVSITGLEFSYTQAPKKMKSFIMAIFLLSVAFGNELIAEVNKFIQNEDGSSKLEGASYYWFFTGLMLLAAIGFLVVVRFYKGRTYIQE